MRKVIILRSAENELANQLWNYASIYAYTLEKKCELKNPAFFEYGTDFNTPTPNWFIKIFFFLPFKNYTKRKTSFRRKVWRKFYIWYTTILMRIHKQNLLSYANYNNKPYYLPPTKKEGGILKTLEQKNDDLYLDGWLFRNPVGIRKYRKEIQDYLKPRTIIRKQVDSNIKDLRTKYKLIIGVHIRQTDYETWRDGGYFIPQARVREILNEYLGFTEKNKNEVCFVITSDGPVNNEVFNGLNIFVSKDNAVHDLFVLASTDIIIGSNSTFGAFASYYGNIPFIVMQKNNLDWKYYQNKTTFFENKYSTFVHY